MCVIEYAGPNIFDGRSFYLFGTFSDLAHEQMQPDASNRPGVALEVSLSLSTPLGKQQL